MQEDTLRLIQRYLQDVPLIILGSGASIPHGIPGMNELAEHIVDHLSDGFEAESSWAEFRKLLADGLGLEPALQKVRLSHEMHNALVMSTWEFINAADQRTYEEYLLQRKRLPLADLLNIFLSAHPKKATIVTTNYDRLAEYSIDQAQAFLASGFFGQYIGHFAGVDSIPYNPDERVVTLLKVHGSLDWFRSVDVPVMLPRTFSCPTEYSPLIISPGLEKYQETHQEPFRSMITLADQAIRGASAYLCLGYGFNDDHIHPTLVNEVVQRDKPIVLVTRTATEKANRIISQASKYAVIESTDKSGALVRTPDETSNETLPIWMLAAFIETIW